MSYSIFDVLESGDVALTDKPSGTIITFNSAKSELIWWEQAADLSIHQVYTQPISFPDNYYDKISFAEGVAKDWLETERRL